MLSHILESWLYSSHMDMPMTLLRLRRSVGSYFARKNVPGSEWLEFWNELQPKDNGHELIRIGNARDGGYLLPNDLLNLGICISPGVSSMMDFELQLAESFSIPSLLMDASILPPDSMHPLLTFRSTFVGPYSHDKFTTLPSICLELQNQGKQPPWLLQMDIEGFEYSTLLATPSDLLKEFRILVIEFHSVQDWIHTSYFQNIIQPLFAGLKHHFDIVHVHPNNCDGTFRFKGRIYPRALEMTFHNKNRRKSIGNLKSRNLPHQLDLDNSDKLPSIKLKF